MPRLTKPSNALLPTRRRGELVPLDWDTRQFGFPVARIQPSDADVESLSALLVRARTYGVEMVVWTAAADREVPFDLLHQYSGTLVDQKATFVANLANVQADKPDTRGEDTTPADPRVQPYTHAIASDDLIALSIAAGVYSRFHVDPRFPREKFEDLYRIWIERSVRHELADDVLVAHDSTAGDGRLAGMVTVSANEGVGSIGLIAVAETARGRGVGRRLITAAHAWMLSRGAREARVVTQRTNAPACRLYESTGYRFASVERYYHFWPQIH